MDEDIEKIHMEVDKLIEKKYGRGYVDDFIKKHQQKKTVQPSVVEKTNDDEFDDDMKQYLETNPEMKEIYRKWKQQQKEKDGK